MILFQSRFSSLDVDDVLSSAHDAWSEVDHVLDIEAVLHVVEELMDNAVRHSGLGGGSLLIEQVADSVLARVEDVGVGIHHRMAAGSEEQSVALAFQPGPEGTSTGSPTRGGGLVLAVRYTALVPDMALCLQSGQAVYTAEGGRGYLATGSGDVHQGVLVDIVVPIYR